MRNVAEDHERQQSADEGRDGIIGACSCRTEDSLCVNVEKDTESVRNESYAENGEYAPKHRNAFSDAKTDDNRSESRKDTLQENDLQRIFL